MSKKFWVDFSGYVLVDAENEQDAETKMWDAINRTLAFPTCFSDDVWDIDGIEEKVDGPLLEPVYGGYLGNEQVTNFLVDPPTDKD